jgi:hypothetical protein
VYSILSRRKALHPVAARALVGVAGCGLLMASVELARCPQMVAFVPAAKTEMARTDSTTRLGDGDRAFGPTTAARGDSGYHAVETKAILPADRRAAPFTSAASRRAETPSVELAGASQRQMASAGETPREVLLRAEMPDTNADDARQNASSDVAGQPQYVVLTTWEEVRTSPRHARMISDYDANANAQAQSADAADAADGQAVTQITVTRLILAVYPIGYGPAGSGLNGSGPGAKSTHAEDSGRPAASVPESGWLVFQL